MLLFWKVRFLNGRDREFKDRDLVLDTDTLDGVTKSAVELSIPNDNPLSKRGILRYRQLFRACSADEIREGWPRHNGRVSCFSVTDYFEDERGN
jgi:hypothetical protein